MYNVLIGIGRTAAMMNCLEAVKKTRKTAALCVY